METSDSDLNIKMEAHDKEFVAWSNIILNLNFMQLIELEYSLKENTDIFKKLLTRTQTIGLKSARCNLCETASLSSFVSILSHLQGKKHTNRVNQNLHAYRHPNIDPFNFTPENSENKMELDVASESKIVLNPVAKSAAKQPGSGRDIVADKKILRQKMLTMPLEDLLLIEYRFINTNWLKLISKNDEGTTYTCTMCNSSPFVNLDELQKHFSETEHQSNTDVVKGLYHPLIAPIKTDDFLHKAEIPQQKSTKSTPEQIVVTSKQKSLINIFRHKMLTLDTDDLEKIEYCYLTGPWKNMLTRSNTNQIKCMLCNLTIMENICDVKQHISGIKHQQHLNGVALIHHPVYANTKLIKVNNDNIEDNELKVIKILDDKTFREEMPNLSLLDMKLVEYTTNGKTWGRLVKMIASGEYKCQVCSGKKVSSYSDFLDHLKEDMHIENSKSKVIRYYCPGKTVDKDYNVEVMVEVARQKAEESVEDKGSEEISSNEKAENIVTIEVEDSPEREIKKEPVSKEEEESTTSVINPIAIVNSNINKNKNDKLSSRVINPAAVKSSRKNLNTSSPQSVTSTFQKVNNNTTSDQSLIKSPLKSVNNNSTSQPQASSTPTKPSSKLSKPSSKLSKPSPKPVDKRATFASKSVTSNIGKNVEGLIGVEYVVKISRFPNDISPKYECCLCEVEVDAIGMQWHLKGLHHRTKFLDRHFPTLMRDFASFKNSINWSSVMAQIADKLAIVIEEHHGRELPYPTTYDYYRSNRNSVKSKVFSFKHASEFNGPSFLDVIDKKLLDEFIAKKDTYKNPELDKRRKITFDKNLHYLDNNDPKKQKIDAQLDVEEHRKLVEEFLQNTSRNNRNRSPRRRSRSKSPSNRYSHYSHHNRRSRSPRRNRTRSRSRSRSISDLKFHFYPKQNHSSPVRDGDVWQSYRRQFDRALETFDKNFDKYRKCPERHPNYQSEWQKFWNDRTQEILAEGRDPSTYDFAKEWIPFFTNRLNIMYEEEVENIRKNLRRKLGLRLQNIGLKDSRYHVGIDRFNPIFQQQQQQQQQQLEQQDQQRFGQMFQQQIGHQLNTETTPQMQRLHHLQQTQQMQQIYQIPAIPPNPHGMTTSIQPVPPPLLHQPVPPPLLQQQVSPVFHNISDRHPSSTINNNSSMEYYEPEQSFQSIPLSIPSQERDKNNYGSKSYNQNIKNIRINEFNIADNMSSTSSTLAEIEKLQRKIDAEMQKPISPIAYNRRSESPSSSPPPTREKNSKRHFDGKKHRSEKKKKNRNDSDSDTERITPVSVLRILTALEDHLGSLGPKVVNLLAKALTLEKVNPKTVADTLLTVENCVFLETVREKLKGQIFTEVLDESKTRAAKRAVKDVTDLLEYVEHKRLNESSSSHVEEEIVAPPPPKISKPIKPATVTVPKVTTSIISNSEKNQVASQLATVLSAQGKTNVSKEDLDQLATIYSLLQKKAVPSQQQQHQRQQQQRQQQQQQQQQQQHQQQQQQQHDHQQFRQKSLSDTLSDLISKSSSANTSKPNYGFNTKLADFDTSLRLDKTVSSSPYQNKYNPTNQINVDNLISTSTLTNILHMANENSNITDSNKDMNNSNRANLEGIWSNFGRRNVDTNRQVQQQQQQQRQTQQQQQQQPPQKNIPSLFPNYGNVGVNKSMISYPTNNQRLNVNPFKNNQDVAAGFNINSSGNINHPYRQQQQQKQQFNSNIWGSSRGGRYGRNDRR